MLLDRVNPSGKTHDTWAKDLTDYPTTAGWDQQHQAYTEDIFVGYRWFETFDPAYETVNYEFGYGLSYTTFNIETKNFSYDGGSVTVDAVVTNTGSVPGKEVVQLYVAASQGVLGKTGHPSAFVLKEGAKQVLWTLVRTPRYYRANTCALPCHYDEYGRCTVCHRPDPAVRQTLAKRLAELVPEADLDSVFTRFDYPGVRDFFARNTESFCAEIMAFFKAIFNFFTQIFGRIV